MVSPCRICEKPANRPGRLCAGCYRREQKLIKSELKPEPVVERPPLTPEQYAEAMPWALTNQDFLTDDPLKKFCQDQLKDDRTKYHAMLDKWAAKALTSASGSNGPGGAGPDGTSSPGLAATWDGAGECPTCRRGPEPEPDAGALRARAVLEQVLAGAGP